MFFLTASIALFLMLGIAMLLSICAVYGVSAITWQGAAEASMFVAVMSAGIGLAAQFAAWVYL